jgi:hypothetical protein
MKVEPEPSKIVRQVAGIVAAAIRRLGARRLSTRQPEKSERKVDAGIDRESE